MRLPFAAPRGMPCPAPLRGCAALLLLAVVPAFAAASGAAADLQPDLRAMCPDIEGVLADELASVAQSVGDAGSVTVRFTIEGTRIDEVTPQGGPVRYQRAVRRAVRGLLCRAPGPAKQAVQLTIRFTDRIGLKSPAPG